MSRSSRDLTVPERLLIFDFDPVRQGRYREEHGESATIAMAIGQLRLALLVSPTIFLNHSMLFDGLLFRTMGPRDLAHALGVYTHRLPLVVLAIDGNLEQTLRQLVNNREHVWQNETPSADDPILEEWLDAARRGWLVVEEYPLAPPLLRAGFSNRCRRLRLLTI